MYGAIPVTDWERMWARVKDKFAAYHPVINFTFFIGAIVFGMILIHPVFQVCSLILSNGYYLTVQGKKGLKFVTGMGFLLVVLSVLNPVFNTLGETVLFTYFERPYTLEALFYGIALSAMLVSVLSWFASYQVVMTSDKFLYLFGKMAPSVTLILTMVLRLIPAYKDKTGQMNGARRCIGKGTDMGSMKEKTEHGMVLLSALTSWALEGGVITADSMRSRGYGCGRRTTFSIYRFEGRDKRMFAGMIVLIAVVAFCCVNGAASVTYVPEFECKGIQNPYMFTGLLAYVAFLSIPTVVNIWEELRWRSLRSKI